MILAATIAPGVVTKGAAGYGLEITVGSGGRPEIVEEWLFDVVHEHAFFRAAGGELFDHAPAGVSRKQLRDPIEAIDNSASVLSQRRDPRGFAEGTKLADRLIDVRLYLHWTVGPTCPLRSSRRIDLPTNSLLETFENFPGRLATLKGNPAVKRRMLDLLDEVSPGFSDIEIVPEGGALQVYLIEGERKISTYRLSDGTLRYLMLLTVLLDPSPPPLLVIEEPELSLHPDVLPRLRDLLIAAGERTQVIVTTQSPTFLDSWTGNPEYLVVCERDGESTSFERLTRAHTAHGDDGLGVRWNRGEFGGNRW